MDALLGRWLNVWRKAWQECWRRHPRKQQLFGHLPPITKTIQVRHVGHCLRSKDELHSDILLWAPSHWRAKAGRPARTYTQQLCADTGYSLEDLREWWTIEMVGERGSGRSVLAAQDDDDIYIVIHRQTISLYHNSSIWVDTRDTSSWNRNPAGFTSHGNLTPKYRPIQRKWRNFFWYTFIYLYVSQIPECSIYK